MVYYKGLIIDTKLMKDYSEKQLIGSSLYPHGINNISIFDLKITYEKRNKLKNIINEYMKKDKLTIYIDDEWLINLFNSIMINQNQELVKQVNNITSNIGTTIPIVYELVKDKEGNMFGRELYTKELFPIYNQKCEEFCYYIDIIKSLDLEINGHLYVPKRYEFEVVSKPSIDVSSMLKCEDFIVGHQVANINDFNKYMNKFRGTRIFKRNEEKEIQRYKEKIINCSQANVFKDDFCLVEESKEEKIKDVVLNKIAETNLKIENSILNEEKKLELKNNLIELAYYYVNTLKSMNFDKQLINLDTNQIAIIGLRTEIMKKLFEIEMQLPPENLNVLNNDLLLLEKEINARKK